MAGRLSPVPCADVVPILQREAPDQVDLYQALRLPAARADIARLALLLDRGGLYVDCHCGMRDPAEVHALLADLGHLDLIVMRRNPATVPPGPDGPRPVLMNGVMAARPGAPILREMLLTVLENLERHLQDLAEADGAPVPYDIWSMLGGWVLTNLVLEAAASYRDFRRALRGKVRILPHESCPIRVSAHKRSYNGTRHWSRVQAEEPLLDPAMLPALLAARQGRVRFGFSDPADPPGAPSAP